jgi:hypothetical protein
MPLLTLPTSEHSVLGVVNQPTSYAGFMVLIHSTQKEAKRKDLPSLLPYTKDLITPHPAPCFTLGICLCVVLGLAVIFGTGIRGAG